MYQSGGLKPFIDLEMNTSVSVNPSFLESFGQPVMQVSTLLGVQHLYSLAETRSLLVMF